MLKIDFRQQKYIGNYFFLIKTVVAISLKSEKLYLSKLKRMAKKSNVFQ